MHIMRKQKPTMKVLLVVILPPLLPFCQVSVTTDGVFGCGAHSDYGMLTILATDSTAGLQVWCGRGGLVNPGDSVHVGFLEGRCSVSLHVLCRTDAFILASRSFSGVHPKMAACLLHHCVFTVCAHLWGVGQHCSASDTQHTLSGSPSRITRLAAATC